MLGFPLRDATSDVRHLHVDFVRSYCDPLQKFCDPNYVDPSEHHYELSHSGLVLFGLLVLFTGVFFGMWYWLDYGDDIIWWLEKKVGVSLSVLQRVRRTVTKTNEAVLPSARERKYI